MRASRFITPAELAEILPQAVVVDCAQKPAYQRFHIPGAYHSPCRYWKEQGGDTGLYAMDCTERFAHLVSRWGITPDRPIVGYDNSGGLNAARLGWTFERFGLEHFQVLDGGIGAWYDEGLPLSGELPKSATSRFPFQGPRLHNCAKLVDVEASKKDPDHIFWDDRSHEEWARGGIPGAVHLEWTELLAPNKKLLPEAQIRTRLAELGMSPDKALTVYCQGGIRAAHSYWILKHLNYPRVRVYDASWAEYGLGGG